MATAGTGVDIAAGENACTAFEFAKMFEVGPAARRTGLTVQTVHGTEQSAVLWCVVVDGEGVAGWRCEVRAAFSHQVRWCHGSATNRAARGSSTIECDNGALVVLPRAWLPRDPPPGCGATGRRCDGGTNLCTVRPLHSRYLLCPLLE
jgi:hypothetical protein